MVKYNTGHIMEHLIQDYLEAMISNLFNNIAIKHKNLLTTINRLYSLSLTNSMCFMNKFYYTRMTQAGKLVCSYYEESIKDNQYNINNIAI